MATSEEVIDPRIFDILTDVALTARLPDGRTAVFGVQILAAELTDRREVRHDGVVQASLPIRLGALLIAVNPPGAGLLAEMGVTGLDRLKPLR